jgi:hypothetical protein
MTAEQLDDDGMAVRHRLADRVAEHPELLPVEKESTVRWGADDSDARVHTDERSVARSLLLHPHVSIDSVVLHTGGVVDTAAAVDAEAPIGSVIADMPVALLKVRRSPRDSEQHGRIVSRWSL